jgi:hypothetical protein
MRARLLLWFSLVTNMLLAGMIVMLSREWQNQSSTADIYIKPSNGVPQVKTNVVLRRQFFSWSEVESPDYPVYIANLRKIGCPEKTIRDIIVADVNELFAERMAKELILPEQKWWLPEPEMDAFESAMNQVRALETEKIAMLTQLLGPGWESSRNTMPANLVRFDGPVLNNLSREAKLAVQRIEANQRRAISEALDPSERSRLQAELRKQLSLVLTPPQLEEYLLRYSETAERMRDQLRGFAADADEFRRIFRARDPFDQQLAELAGDDAITQQRRAELERSRDEAIRQTLGPERASFYQVTQNPLFREAQEQAQRSGAPPEKVLPLFEVNRAVQEEIARIQNDVALSEDQRRLALVTVQQQQRNSVERILNGDGAEAPATTRETTPVGAASPPLPPGFIATPVR